jgi:outer membrane protein insertion porin family
MKFSVYYTYLLILLSLFGSSYLHGQEGYTLEDIYFIGNESFSRDELVNQTFLYTLSWFEKNILRKDKFIFSAELLEADIKKMIKFYQQQGYIDVNIYHRLLNIDHDKRTLELEIIISEENYVIVEEISFVHTSENRNAENISDSLMTELRTDLELKKDVRFQDSFLESDKNRIIYHYLNSGFAYVEVDHEIMLNNDETGVEIIWKVNAGPRCYFGQIQVFSENENLESLIQDRIEFNSGDLYRKVLLDTTQQSIYSLGLFQVVSVTAFLDNKKSKILPVKISVKETPTISTRFGVGYGTEAKFRVFADITKISFLGGARRLQLIVGHSAIQPYNIDLRFIQPAFITRALTLVLNPFIREQDEPGFQVERRGAKSTFLYSFLKRLTSSITYTYEDVQRDTIDFDPGIPIFDERYRGLYDKSMINLGLNWDTSYPMFTPERGFLTSINFQYNGVITAVEYPFQKTILDIRTYQKVYFTVLALRLKMGGILPIRDNTFIPVEERFYAGGSYSVRGWARQMLGPLGLFGNPSGGKSLFEFSSEFRYPVYDIVSGVAFMDCGNVWIESYTWKLNELRYSLGLGIRINTPIGPVRLDAARPIFDEETKIQIHFSVGHAF